MRSIARQSTRLAGHSHVRTPSCPRCASFQQDRSFSRSARRRLDPRTPPGVPEDVGRHAADSANKKHEGTETRQIGSAQEAQNETDGPPRRKTYRQRRSEALSQQPPKPPPIPDWFLKHNVKLRVDSMQPDQGAEGAKVLRCIDRETGHTLFCLPYFGAWPIQELRRSIAKGESEQERDRTETMSPDGIHFSTNLPADTTSSENGATVMLASDEHVPDMNAHSQHSLLRWTLLEAETAIRAGFAMATTSPKAASKAASRVDVSIRCWDGNSHDDMDDLVEDLASLVQASLIRLDVNDLADLTDGFVSGGDGDPPGSFSTASYDVYAGYEAGMSAAHRSIDGKHEEEMNEEEEDEEEDEEGEDDNAYGLNGPRGSPLSVFDSLKRALYERRHDLEKALNKVEVGVPVQVISGAAPVRLSSFSPDHSSVSTQSRVAAQIDEGRLQILLEDLLEAPKVKMARADTEVSSNGSWKRWPDPSAMGPTWHMSAADQTHQRAGRMWRQNLGCWLSDVARALLDPLIRQDVKGYAKKPIMVESVESTADTSPITDVTPSTIIHVRDLKDMCGTRTGNILIQNLVQVVQRRRAAGERILIVGTTAQDSANGMFASFGRNASHDLFRRITVSPFFRMPKEELSQFKVDDHTSDKEPDTTYRRILEINLRHMQTMLRQLRPYDHSQSPVDLFSKSSWRQLKLGGNLLLAQRVLSFDEVQRLMLTAIGLSSLHAVADNLNASHIGLAIYITSRADQLNRKWSQQRLRKEATNAPASRSKENPSSDSEKSKAKMDKLKKDCNQHESRLLGGVVDPQNLKTGFKEVHAPIETIEALKSMTSLSLLRPDAFKYGVLAADRLPGMMLYGPPGTGKTLLAKAVAKESRATMLEISGAQIYEKYVGEGEKMVKAVFSLAKKLSPCIVFIDEADAIFGSRSSAGNRNTHREIINQFLREWDGMELHNVFIMVASNRPFDLDDAVLRRLPRRLLVDLPIAKDRESILKIHLREEALDDSVSLHDLAEQTPLYSGSDLKNLCVSAALACVREENELMDSSDTNYTLPEKRTLSARHFEQAIKEISASISEDMSTLTAIKKFDEQYGDRSGRKKKASYGFGTGDRVVDEGAARVRSTPPPTP